MRNGTMIALYSQKQRPLEVATPLGTDILLLKGFTGREGVSQLFDFRLELLAENPKAVVFDKFLGQPVTVRLALGGGHQRFFHGIVSRFSEGRQDQRFTHYRAQVVPQFWLLTRRVRSRIFQHQTVPQILKEVLEGLSVSFHIQGTFHARDFVAQYRESDFAFASRLMEEEGICYFFRHAADGHQLVLTNAAQGHPDVPAPNTVVHDDATGGNRDEFRVTEWEKVQELRSGKVTLWDHSFELPGKHLEAQRPINASVQVGKVPHKLQTGGNGNLEIYDYPGGYAGRFDGVGKDGGERPAELQKIFEDNQRTARIRMEQEAYPGLVIQGASTCRHFTSGHRFTLKRHANADGAYILTTVEHFAELGSGFGPGEVPELEYRNRFQCVPANVPICPPRLTPRPRVEGTQTAIVVGHKDEEIFVDKYGRVKVKFHWDRDPKANADSSCWVRVAQPWAGKQYGAFFWPRVGHEVVVAFLEGDPDQPIIVGSVYNAGHMPPSDLPRTRMVNGLRTNSTPGGGGYNCLIFDDTKGKEAIVLHGQHDMATTIEHDDTQTIVNDRTITVKGKHTETIIKDTKIVIAEGKFEHAVAKGTASYQVKDDVTETFEGKQTTVVSKDVHLESKTKIELICGKSSLVLNQDGTILIVGEMITSQATGTHEIIGGLVKIN
jgi:type VI secretion system secreted protein VgrG